MFNSVRVLQIGCGKMSKYIMRYIFEKGGAVVAAVDKNPNLQGQDIGVVMETASRGAIIYGPERLEEIIISAHPQIAIVSTMSLLGDIAPTLRTLLRNGINVITTCEEAFYAKNSNPVLFKELDDLAKANRCTLIGCGYQDVFWGSLVTSLSGSIQKIIKIKGSSSYNVEDYGLALAKAHGAGLTIDEFNSTIASADNITRDERQNLINTGAFLPSYMWNTVGWLIEKMSLTLRFMDQKCIPTTSDTVIHSKTLNMDIPVGNATGMSAVVTAMTEQNIIIEAECIGKIYGPNDIDANIWTIEGEPNTTLTINSPKTVELTCANVVNRIPDVLNAKYGFLSTVDLGEPTYKSKRLNEYLVEKNWFNE